MARLLRRVLGQKESGSLEARPCLLLGEGSSGKTSLLLAAALSSSAEEGRGTLFISRSPLQRLPESARDPLSLKKIHFVYPRSFEELLSLIAAMHENTKSSPSLIILNGMDRFLVGNNGPQAAARLSALLVDTAAYFTDKLRSASRGLDDASCCCHLIASMRLSPEETEGAQDRSLIERYFPVRCWMERDVSWHGTCAQEDAIERYYRPRFSDSPEANLDTGHASNDKTWRVSAGSDGALMVSAMQSQGRVLIKSGKDLYPLF
ncbi:hypothetical protein NDU88_004245 [Pleurodeles waltl]|uniref:Uncharacterized protein n=1 Tax=Pleurodeles waltl TaxID=8319 RepID=A0AAV7T7B7_PLEWA|nr:hypothetical protein NDU88_004245 [Pleurodeles waltl]